MQAMQTLLLNSTHNAHASVDLGLVLNLHGSSL
jgi:hypothetical protein